MAFPGIRPANDREPVPLAPPDIGDAEIAAAARVIRSGWLTQGREVEAFEAEFADFVGAPHAVAVANGSIAIMLALQSAGIGPGDEVITPSLSFIATADAIRQTGALPVFADIDRETGNLDPSEVERAITPRTRAVLCVHQLGMPSDLAALGEICRRSGLTLIEDAACAAGSEIHISDRWERIGRPHGLAACFSFHPRKALTTGEGGMITTADAELAARLRLLRSHGMSQPAHHRHAAKEVRFESYELPGFNYRLSDIAAAIGRAQLERLGPNVARRRALARRYCDALTQIPGFVAPIERAWARSNWQSFQLRLPDHLDQRVAMQRLLEDGIATRRAVMCAHREPAYPPGTWRCAGNSACGCPPARCRALARSEDLQDRAIIIPLFPQMSEAQQDRVIGALMEISKL